MKQNKRYRDWPKQSSQKTTKHMIRSDDERKYEKKRQEKNPINEH